MKRLILLSAIVLITSFAHAQVQNSTSTPTPSIDNQNVTYKLFPTTNIYNLIKLDTRNGQMWLVQWSTDSDKRFTSLLNLIPLVSKEDEKIGRFTLYPTQNIYTFILVDQIDGRTWQVQWSIDVDKRGILPIL